MHLGVALPLGDIGGDPGPMREFAQAAEAEGYDDLMLPDHVLGANVASRPNWEPGRTTSANLFHDPFVAFAFLAACTTRIGFSTQVMILPQRQTVLVAKQAACLDVLCGGRFRLGVGVGWNEVEFVGLGENFHDRGRRSEEQVQVMQALWREPHVTFKGRWHTIEDAGINPLPPRRRIPIWFGGHVDATLRRIAKWGDGWMMLSHPPDESARAAFATLRRYVEAEGRNPATVGIEVWVSTGSGAEAEWREEFRFWKAAGVTHVTLNNTYARYHHKRIAGRAMADHLEAMRRWRDAVADLL
jgi:probable F420-dependent oxidoreductase